jgi:hypothetical protein
MRMQVVKYLPILLLTIKYFIYKPHTEFDSRVDITTSYHEV